MQATVKRLVVLAGGLALVAAAFGTAIIPSAADAADAGVVVCATANPDGDGVLPTAGALDEDGNSVVTLNTANSQDGTLATASGDWSEYQVAGSEDPAVIAVSRGATSIAAPGQVCEP